MKFLTASIALAVVSTCFLIATPAISDDEDFMRAGPYLGIAVIGASHTEIEDTSRGVDADESVGFSLLGGYRIGPAFAVEAQFEMLPDVNVKAAGFAGLSDFEKWTATGNFKAFLYPGRIQPYVLMGLGAMKVKFDQPRGGNLTGFAYRFGGGVDFYVTKNVVAFAGVDYVLPAADKLKDLDHVSFGGGVQYRF